jgi:GntR family transcriptional regulator/MocR family aminotransferase
MRDAITEYGLTIARSENTGGSSFWMRAPDGTDTEALAERLLPLGVLIEPGNVFFDRNDAPNEFYRLAYSSINSDRIREGIRIISSQI